MVVNGSDKSREKMSIKNSILKRSFDSPFFRAVCLNLFYLAVVLLLFEPTYFNDDFSMALATQGALPGMDQDTPDYHTQFESFYFGKMIAFFQQLFPTISCYFISFYLLNFLALTFLSYEFLQREHQWICLIAVSVLLFFYAYELYIPLQFTKTAGALSCTGVWLITHSRWNPRKLISGIFFFTMGYWIRDSMAFMAMGSIFLFFLFSLFEDCLDWIRDSKKRPDRIKKAVCKKDSIHVFLLFVFVILSHLNPYGEEKEFWTKVYPQDNSIRSSIQDYLTPEIYEENAKQFEKAGMSEADFKLWYGWNYDMDRITDDIVAVVRRVSLHTVYPLTSVSSVFSFLKKFPRAFFSIDCFYAFLLLSVLSFLFTQKLRNALWSVFKAFAILMSSNYYLFCLGRILRHRVDVMILFCGCIFLLDYLTSSQCEEICIENISWKVQNKTVAVFAVVLVATFFAAIFYLRIILIFYATYSVWLKQV